MHDVQYVVYVVYIITYLLVDMTFSVLRPITFSLNDSSVNCPPDIACHTAYGSPLSTEYPRLVELMLLTQSLAPQTGHMSLNTDTTSSIHNTTTHSHGDGAQPSTSGCTTTACDWPTTALVFHTADK